MKKLIAIFIIICSCNNRDVTKLNNSHIENLAKDFMKKKVIPQMKEPRPFAIAGAEVVRKTVNDKINDYRFTYEHLSLNKADSIENKKLLDSVVQHSLHPDSVINITVDVAYKIKYKLGDIVTDKIKLAYDPVHDKISYWPF